MYRRIKNELDMTLLEDELRTLGVDNIVLDRMREIIFTLDDAYKTNRGSRDMGGYIFFFDNEENYKNALPQILEFHNLRMEDYEYSEIINNNIEQGAWWEELYLLSSDDAIVLVHPKGA